MMYVPGIYPVTMLYLWPETQGERKIEYQVDVFFCNPLKLAYHFCISEDVLGTLVFVVCLAACQIKATLTSFSFGNIPEQINGCM